MDVAKSRSVFENNTSWLCAIDSCAEEIYVHHVTVCLVVADTGGQVFDEHGHQCAGHMMMLVVKLMLKVQRTQRST